MITMLPFFDFDNKFQPAAGDGFEPEKNDPQASEFAELLAAVCPAPPQISPEKIVVEHPEFSTCENSTPNVAFDSPDKQAETPEAVAQNDFAPSFAESDALTSIAYDKMPQMLNEESVQPVEAQPLTLNPAILKTDLPGKQSEMPETVRQKDLEQVFEKSSATKLPTPGKIPPQESQETVNPFETFRLIINQPTPKFDSLDKVPETSDAPAEKGFEQVFKKPEVTKTPTQVKTPHPAKEESVPSSVINLSVENAQVSKFDSLGKQSETPKFAESSNFASINSESDTSKQTTPVKTSQTNTEETAQLFETPSFEKNPPIPKQDSPVFKLPLSENNFQIVTPPPIIKFESSFTASPASLKDDSPILKNSFQNLEANSQTTTAAPQFAPPVEIVSPELPESNETFKLPVKTNSVLENDGEIELPETSKTVETATTVSLDTENGDEINLPKTLEPISTDSSDQIIKPEPKTTTVAARKAEVFIDAAFPEAFPDQQIFAAAPLKNQKENGENIEKSEITLPDMKVETPKKSNQANVSEVFSKAFSPFESNPVRQTVSTFQTAYESIAGWMKTAVTREAAPVTEKVAPQISTEKTGEMPELSFEPIRAAAPETDGAKKISENFSGDNKTIENAAQPEISTTVKLPFKPEPELSEKTHFRQPLGKLNMFDSESEIETRNIIRPISENLQVSPDSKKSQIQPREQIVLPAAADLPDLEKSMTKPLNEPIAEKAAPENSSKSATVKSGQTIEIADDKSRILNVNPNPEKNISFTKSFLPFSENHSEFVQNFKNSIPALSRLTAEIRSPETAAAKAVEKPDSIVDNAREIEPSFASETPQTEPQIAFNNELGEKESPAVSLSAPETGQPKKSKVKNDLNRIDYSLPRKTIAEKPVVNDVREFAATFVNEVPPTRELFADPPTSTVNEILFEKATLKTSLRFQTKDLSGAEIKTENQIQQETTASLTTEIDAAARETHPTDPQIAVNSQLNGQEPAKTVFSFVERVMPKKSKAGNVELNLENTPLPRQMTAEKFSAKPASEVNGTNFAEATPVREQVLENLIAAMKENATENEPRKIRVRLRPEDLGGVEIQIENANPQEIKARFVTDTEAARIVLSENIKQLNETLQAAGWNIERLEVVCRDSASNSFGERQNRPQSTETGDKNASRQQAEMNPEPEAQPDKLLSVRA